MMFGALCILSNASVAQNDSSSKNSQAPHLKLTVRTDRSTYSMKDKLHIEVQLTNVGNSDVYVMTGSFVGARAQP